MENVKHISDSLTGIDNGANVSNVTVFESAVKKSRLKCSVKSNRISCEFCPETFLTPNKHWQHCTKNHRGQVAQRRWTKCQFCPEYGDTDAFFASHLCKGRIQCSFCLIITRWNENFVDHNNAKHLDQIKDTWTLRCQVCRVYFPALSYLKLHSKKTKHNNLLVIKDRRTRKCDDCHQQL